jgi:hypothetical protein
MFGEQILPVAPNFAVKLFQKASAQGHKAAIAILETPEVAAVINRSAK